MRFDENIIYDEHNNVLIKTFYSNVLSRRASFREHHHTECELSLVISGKGLYYVGEKKYEFNTGDMFLFGSNEAHCITDIYEELNLLNIQFEPRILWENPENIELLNLFMERTKNFSNKFYSSDVELRDIILKLKTEISSKDTGYKIHTKYLLLSALIHIMRNYEYAHINKALTSHSTVTESLKAAMTYINSNLENKIKLKDISDVAYMTQTYFSSVFKKFNGVSPWEYITIKRVEMAIELLKTTDMTKLEIAEKCGFKSSANFYKAFNNITGKKPKDFTKNDKQTT